MHRKLIIFFGLMIISSFTVAHGAERFLTDGDTIYYLSNDTIYRMVSPETDKAEVVFTAPKETTYERYQISGLACGPDDSLLFNLVQSHKNVTDFSKPLYRVVIAAFNLRSKEMQTLVDVGDTSVDFPSLSPDGSKLVMSASDAKHQGFYFIVKDLKTGATSSYDRLQASSKLVSWSPDNKTFAFTGVGGKSGKVRMFFFDTGKNELKPWLEGKGPLVSRSGHLIAYTTADQRNLIISDQDGKTTQRFDGYLFKDLNGWIGDKEVLFTIGHFMYENHIGIADLEKKKIYDIKPSATGEISGMCYRPAHK